LENVEAVERNAFALVRGYLEAHRDEIGIADLDMAAFICVTTIEALTHTAVLSEPDMLRDERLEHFTDEVTRLIVQYLRGARH
jgi:hypothetical protein